MIYDNTDTNEKIYDGLLKLRRNILDKVELCDRIINYLDVVYSADVNNKKTINESNGKTVMLEQYEYERRAHIDSIIEELDNTDDGDDVEAITEIIARINFVRHRQGLNDKVTRNASDS